MANNRKKESKAQKYKKRALETVVLLAIIVALYTIGKSKSSFDKELHERIMADSYDLTDHSSELLSYTDYLKQYVGTDTSLGEEITINGNGFTGHTLSELSFTDGNSITTGSEGCVNYTVDIKKSGLYAIEVGYYPYDDSNKQILRTLYVNGQVPFEQAKSLNFERIWVDENKSFLGNTGANQATPNQVQAPFWTSKLLTAQDMSCDGPILIYLEKGQNVLAFESELCRMGISYVKLIGSKGLCSYSEYIEKYKAQGALVINASEIEKGMIKVQAENTAYKSSAMNVPKNNRTSPLTEPYHYSNIVLNTIGGSTWKDAGQSVTWQVEIPKSGFYKIAARYLQAENRDFWSVRQVLINGEIPFAEAANITFEYDSSFHTDYFGNDDEDFLFYFEEGFNTITMCVGLGDLKYAVSEAHVSVVNFNRLYREIVAITGSEPDKKRNYNFERYIPDIVERLETEYYRLNLIMDSLGESMDNAAKTNQVAKLCFQMEKLIKIPNGFNKELKNFNSNVTALSDWMLSLDEQPLEIDYLMICGEGAELPKAEGGFFKNLKHGFLAFIGSFTNDYQTAESDSIAKDKTIEVWIATGTRDQFDVAQKMVLNSFADKDYKVVIKMVGAETVTRSTLTGNGPDVAIQLNYTMPVNFAFRNAGYDLTIFDDFDEVAAAFSPAAFEYFEYEGGIYALPDQMSFPVLFYRKDILKEMGLNIPNTWREFEALLPYLQAENMDAYMLTGGLDGLGGSSSTSTVALSVIFSSLLNQNGIELFSDDNTSTRLDELGALLTFKKWTEYYTKHDMPYSISAVQRFRTGDCPIVIADYMLINQLLAAAPEIDGQWDIAPIPGTVREDGTFDRSVTAMVGASMIIKTTVEANDTAAEAWDFLKWWTSAETQTSYAEQQKSILGDAANHPVANVEAMLYLAEDMGFKNTIAETLDWARGVPQIPGGYITGRFVHNAFSAVISENVDPVDEIYSQVRFINKEIENKRKEFGLSE